MDLKDRFRTVFPEEYRLHNNQLKLQKGLPLTPGVVSSFQTSVSNGTTPENPIVLELDYQAARLHKKLNRKKTRRQESDQREESPVADLGPVSINLTTATGRRKVTVKKDRQWTAQEDADLEAAFNKV